MTDRIPGADQRWLATRGMTFAEKIAYYTPQGLAADECWPWTGTLNSTRYGQFLHDGKRWIASRAVWTQSKGKIPAGLSTLHRCDNPPCVNLRHLFLGTYGDNARDRNAKGRAASKKGENNGRALLTAAIVREMRRLFANGGRTKTSIAADFGVSPEVASAAIRGATWRHL